MPILCCQDFPQTCLGASLLPLSLSEFLPLLLRIKCKFCTIAFKCLAPVSNLLMDSGPTLLSAHKPSGCLSLFSPPPRMSSPELLLSPAGVSSGVTPFRGDPSMSISFRLCLPPTWSSITFPALALKHTMSRFYTYIDIYLPVHLLPPVMSV